MSQNVIVKLRGGLGNQMFQYAAGYAAARRQGKELFLDLSAYENQFSKDEPRAFELDAFNLSFARVARRRNTVVSMFLRRAVNKLFPANPYAFKSHVFSYKILDGYYQNERYFLHIREHILREFALRAESGIFSETKKFIRSGTGVSLHVRRGDYMRNQYAHSYHGVLGLTYYQKAYEHLVSRIGSDFVLFIFTDDVEWAKENLSFHKNTFILSGQGFNSAEELTLMSHCAHNIIANSTFSWWGAWLNQHPNKIVIAPKRWTAKNDSSDIIPLTWTKI